MLTGLLFELKRETLIQRDSMVSQLFHGAALQHPQLPFLVSELWLQEQTNTAGWLGQDERGARWLGGPCVGLQCRRSTPIEENQACLRFKSTTKTRKKQVKHIWFVSIHFYLMCWSQGTLPDSSSFKRSVLSLMKLWIDRSKSSLWV